MYVVKTPVTSLSCLAYWLLVQPVFVPTESTMQRMDVVH